MGSAGVIFSEFSLWCLASCYFLLLADATCLSFQALDTETGHPDVVFITGSYGLGENVVQGSVDPDEWFVHKPTYDLGFRAVLNRRMGKKQWTMTYDDESNAPFPVKNTETVPEKMGKFCLTDEQVLELAGFALKIEKHYSELKGSWQGWFAPSLCPFLLL